MRIFQQVALTLALLSASVCSHAAPALETPPAQEGKNVIHNVRGFLPDLRFTLVGAGGKPVTQDAFKGKAVLLFFGYASCPDICPTSLAQLSQVMHDLGPDAEKVRIVFVSVDPHRDTPDKLQAYVNVFGPNIIGLTGSVRQVADVARRYRVAYQIEKPKTHDAENYEVAHSRGVYIFDQRGYARLLAADTDSVKSITDGVRTLLR